MPHDRHRPANLPTATGQVYTCTHTHTHAGPYPREPLETVPSSRPCIPPSPGGAARFNWPRWHARPWTCATWTAPKTRPWWAARGEPPSPSAYLAFERTQRAPGGGRMEGNVWCGLPHSAHYWRSTRQPPLTPAACSLPKHAPKSDQLWCGPPKSMLSAAFRASRYGRMTRATALTCHGPKHAAGY